MKAMRLSDWGQPLRVEEIAQPTPAADEILVRVRAASVNPLDTFVQSGYMQAFMQTPLTLGTDFAGEVVEMGSEVNHLKPGDAVYGLVPMHSGSFAEYLVAKANEVTHKPESLSFEEAAGVPLAAMAAYQSLFDLGQAQKGERVLITGAAGAVGSAAIQMAKELGMTVYAVDYAGKADFVNGLGADRFINADTEKFEDVVGAVDLVLDYVGGDYLQRSMKVLQPGGRYVTSLVLGEVPPDAVARRVQALGLATQPRTDQLDDLARRIDSGRLKTFLNRTFPLEEAQTAIEHRLSKHAPGKVVLVVA